MSITRRLAPSILIVLACAAGPAVAGDAPKEAQGASGVKLRDVLPIGASVKVSYEEKDGQRCARRIAVSTASVTPR